MMFLTKMTDGSGTPLMIGEFYDDAVLAVTPAQQVLRVDRSMIETPVLCCDKCHMPADLKREKKTGKEYAECPNHARHMYEELFAASTNIKEYNHATRRRMHKEAGKWLKKWKIKTAAQQRNAYPSRPGDGKRAAEADYLETYETEHPRQCLNISQ